MSSDNPTNQPAHAASMQHCCRMTNPQLRALLEAAESLKAELGTRLFNASMAIYRRVERAVREDGSAAAIDVLLACTRSNQISHKIETYGTSIITAIGKGMTLRDYLEADSAQSWLERQGSETR